MSRAWIVPEGRARIAVEGVLDFDSVAPLLADGRRQISDMEYLDIDLRGVRRANSAGLALLLEWTQLARRQGTSLRFRNPPESSMSLAALANVSALIPVDQGDA